MLYIWSSTKIINKTPLKAYAGNVVKLLQRLKICLSVKKKLRLGTKTKTCRSFPGAKLFGAWMWHKIRCQTGRSEPDNDRKNTWLVRCNMFLFFTLLSSVFLPWHGSFCIHNISADSGLVHTDCSRCEYVN